MIYTNRQELPGPLFRALTEKTYEKVGDVSVTELLKSPRQRLLALRHDKEIVRDASENLWSVLGTAVHDLLKRHSSEGAEIAERRFSVKIKGPVKEWTLTGEADLIAPDDNGIMTLTDYKVAGVYSYILEKQRGGVKEDWEKQLNMYRWIVKQAADIDVKLLQVGLILRDFMQSKVGQDADYPQQAILALDAIVWPWEKTKAFILDRVRLHQEAEGFSDDNLPECTPEEKWERGETWAVTKKGNKRAERLLSSLAEAEEFKKSIPNSEVTHRPGKPIKCLGYCDGAAFCNVFQKYKEANGLKNEVAA